MNELGKDKLEELLENLEDSPLLDDIRDNLKLTLASLSELHKLELLLELNIKYMSEMLSTIEKGKVEFKVENKSKSH